jgi:2-(1,2-epoxy-1,2-dihydrophenyl)acetyl-CoA isomerase
MEGESFALELSSRTADFKEGLLAFKERRAARFEGQ